MRLSVTRSLFFIVTSLLLVLSVPAEAKYADDLDINRLLGFMSAQGELSVNVCIRDSLLIEHYGNSVKPQIDKARSQWPKGLCDNDAVSKSLLQWKYLSSALLANSDRAAVITREIVNRRDQLHKCKSVSCLKSLLPAFNHWATKKISHTPTAMGYFQTGRKPLVGDLLDLPHLAVRNLHLPLQGQQLSCGDSTMESLQFNLASVKVSGKALVLAQCFKDTKRQRMWLLQNVSNEPGWSEILNFKGRDQFYVFPNTKSEYPVLYSICKLGREDVVTLYNFDQAAKRYKFLVSYLLSPDGFGIMHAFIVEN